ncbi:MAG: ricin-type beta-trefoil lectin domain protein [Vibrio toranzoniae]|uniref:ricin-type beta-trefoil lectin domain protein n=1 Tax=Vibrio toranzoniae TaxID=1194427 RepID=UPI003F97D32F
MHKSFWPGLSLLASSHALASAIQVEPVDPSQHTFSDIYYMQQHNTQDYGNKLTDWLDQGFGIVELDVIDRGRWEHEEFGPYVSHSSSPGNKNCAAAGNTRLGHCFDDIIQWTNQNNPKYPLVVLVDLKVSWDPANAWNYDEVGMIDKWISDYLGEHQYRFSSYLDEHLVPAATAAEHAGAVNPSKHVRELTKAFGWPLLRDLQGKIIVVLTGGKIGSKNQNYRSGWNWLWETHGVVPSTFMCPEGSTIEHIKVGGQLNGISKEESQRFICNNMGQSKHYQNVANEAANNQQMMHIWGDSLVSPETFEYNYLSVSHGVQFINRERSKPQDVSTWGNAIPLIGVRRSIAGFFQIYNEQTRLCLSVKDSKYSNGTQLISSHCQKSKDQKFVYTVESQLRPKGNSRYCVDIKGGKAGNGKDLHLWNCDGGTSERWSITPTSAFINWHSNTSGDDGNGYCMDNKGAGSGTQWHLYSCQDFNANTRFKLLPVTSWDDTHQ